MLAEVSRSCLFCTWVAFLLLGCGGRPYTPNASTFPLDSITEFSSDRSLFLVNGHSTSSELIFASRMGVDWTANLRSWTDTAISITERELTKRGMKIESDSTKKLTLSVQNVSAEFGFGAIRCLLDLRAETGDGYSKLYQGDNRSPANLLRAADGAVMRAVTEMLRDQQIVEYLKK